MFLVLCQGTVLSLTFIDGVISSTLCCFSAVQAGWNVGFVQVMDAGKEHVFFLPKILQDWILGQDWILMSQVDGTSLKQFRRGLFSL